MKKSISVSNLTLDLYLNHVRPAAIKAGILEDAITEEGRPYHIADEAIAKEIEDDMRCACFNAGYDGVERTHEEYIVHEAERDMQPLVWYINTGRASTEFLRLLMNTSPCMVARDLHKGGSYEEAINRVCHRIKYQRDTL